MISAVVIKSHMLIAEKIHFNKEQRVHSINNVINMTTVPVLPAALVTDVFVKLIFPSDTPELTGAVEVVDANNRTLCIESLLPLRNMRREGMVSGMDIHLNIRFPVVEEGTYTYMLYIEDKQINESYLSVFLEE